ncbi:hypothetical protein CFAM422_010026 [Trichoderma lentiforme]|uniref:Uncharacterized protein n=1 Tax=Trichoderma lentiforme TaxID=1567552 RepID=A0A9P4X9P2_9HYPO|nr:hypothetical protein CFAM422_010026 [Trichoderma lentiforme]
MSVSGPLGLGGMDRHPGASMEHRGAWGQDGFDEVPAAKASKPSKVHVAASRAVYDEYPPGSWCSII